MNDETTSVFRIFLSLKKKELGEIFHGRGIFFMVLVCFILFFAFMSLVLEGFLIGVGLVGLGVTTYSIVWLFVTTCFMVGSIALINLGLYVVPVFVVVLGGCLCFVALYQFFAWIVHLFYYVFSGLFVCMKQQVQYMKF